MKYCPKCGTETESKFCPNCGTAMIEKRPRCPRCGTEANSKFCPNCGAAISVGTTPPPRASVSGVRSTSTSAASSAAPAGYKLGWHKFLIYFALWCAGVLDIVNGLRSFQYASELMRYGGSYGGSILVLCIASVAVGVFIIYVRFQLAGFKSGAPSKLFIATGITVAINVISQYYLFRYVEGSNTNAIGSIVGGLVFLLICWKYYSNRKELFVN